MVAPQIEFLKHDIRSLKDNVTAMKDELEEQNATIYHLQSRLDLVKKSCTFVLRPVQQKSETSLSGIRSTGR